jgi:hypothetical protein
MFIAIGASQAIEKARGQAESQAGIGMQLGQGRLGIEQQDGRVLAGLGKGEVAVGWVKLVHNVLLQKIDTTFILVKRIGWQLCAG